MALRKSFSFLSLEWRPTSLGLESQSNVGDSVSVFCNWSGLRKKRLLIVCKANMCRSPVGAILLNHELKARGLDHVYIAKSAGINARTGAAMDPRMRILAEQASLKPGRQRARVVTSKLLCTSHIVFCMEASQAEALRNMTQGCSRAPGIRLFHQTAQDIEDPYFEEMDSAKKVFETIAREARNIAIWLAETQPQSE
jgi:protein-tyrosine phosphatase